MIQDERVQFLNSENAQGGDYVLYWMQHAQRAHYNHALVYAVREANHRRLPLLAVFGITQRFPEANTRSYAFMLEGLRETQGALRDRGIQLTLRLQPPVEAVAGLAEDAALVVVDRGYLRIERRWRQRVAKRLPCRLVQVESDVVVPLETTSKKEEYAAYTIRPRIHRHLDAFLVPLEETPLQRDSLGYEMGDVDLGDVGRALDRMRIKRSADAVATFRGGASQAEALLDDFIASKLHNYAGLRNEPSADYLSHMSPYLHFGQISPQYIAQRVREAEGVGQENKDAYLEELIVRRELSMNFCHYNPDYDSLACLPDWAGKTLEEHAGDRREHIYSLHDFEKARTHDPYWNAAQQEMVLTGKMHGYMRMYWGKKILEWTPSPEVAHRIALELNNRYEIDGRDPNGYTGVAWCFGKHDRAWAEREVYGKVRYMSAGGLERKFDIGQYVRQVQRLMESRAA
ncbi:MAG: deoxyribodipyrimidine photo-lyase [Anaerolineae bacterium]|jgi:deoxyribodipyrimidine photo-lyase